MTKGAIAMRTIGTLIMLGTAGIALYGYTMLFGIGAAFIGLLVLPLATLAYPFVSVSYTHLTLPTSDLV